MNDLLSPPFLRRLHALRQRLARSLRRVELSFESPAGRAVSPEVQSIRPYAAGDDPRAIDWSLFARSDRFFVKSTVREEEGLVHLLLDASRSLAEPYPEKRDLAVELAAAFGYVMLCAGNRVVVSRWCDRLLTATEPLQGEAQIRRLLQELGRPVEAEGETDLDRTLSQLDRLGGQERRSAFLLSDFLDVSAFERKVRHLQSRGVHLSGFQILHPAEVTLKVRGNLQLVNPEGGGSVELVLGHRRLLALRQAVAEHLRRTEQIFGGEAGRFQRVLTGTPFEDVVLRHFRAGAAGR